MAEKQVKPDAQPAGEEQVKDNAAPEAEESAPLSPWDDLVEIRLFKDSGNYRDDVFVAVNGHNYQIQRGVTVKVPRCVAEVLNNSEIQDQRVAVMVEQLEREYDPKNS